MTPLLRGRAGPARRRPLDEESARWLHELAGDGRQREEAVRRLHALLVRVSTREVHRRGHRLDLSGPELDDIAYQAAADATIAVTAKLSQFRGESRFTTWAYAFAVFEVSAKVARHFWARPGARLADEQWAQLPARFGFQPDQEAQWRELLAALRRAVEQQLTERQRRVFVAVVLNDEPMDTLALELSTSRNALYKTLFDARRKLRAALVADGHLASPTEEAVSGWSALERFLRTDPHDVGCDEAMKVMHLYVELVTADPQHARQQFAGLAAHLEACGPCGEDFDGLLAAVRKVPDER
ncbi:sigma-70 family RNA polymerase sigma factor [Angustibacter sp. McL0619]|uniref:sigma-70 family RNA polymerase sigma factor n=1 Tax=Angustibacter sp. McL0619 TaxID=3415676 RepID=UPI003CED2810